MHWYAVNTKPHQEYPARLNLEAVGVETFCPQFRRRKMIRRRMQTVVGPLFPGYLFVNCDLETCCRSVRYARGVRRIVAFGLTPEPVALQVIEAIKARLLNGELAVPAASFAPGQPVRIQDGPLQGLEAIFEREMSDHQRVVLLLRTLASQWRAVVPLEQVANL